VRWCPRAAADADHDARDGCGRGVVGHAARGPARAAPVDRQARDGAARGAPGALVGRGRGEGVQGLLVDGRVDRPARPRPDPRLRGGRATFADPAEEVTSLWAGPVDPTPLCGTLWRTIVPLEGVSGPVRSIRRPSCSTSSEDVPPTAVSFHS